MNSYLLEPVSIGAVIIISVSISFFFLRKEEYEFNKKLMVSLTGFLGLFMILGGCAKFFEPFTSMFDAQIAQSKMPFPKLMRWAGQGGEIFSGILLFALAIKHKSISSFAPTYGFIGANLVVIFIMLVAVYVHLHPDVPADILPLKTKPPILTIIVMAIAALNLHLLRASNKAIKE